MENRTYSKPASCIRHCLLMKLPNLWTQLGLCLIFRNHSDIPWFIITYHESNAESLKNCSAPRGPNQVGQTAQHVLELLFADWCHFPQQKWRMQIQGILQPSSCATTYPYALLKNYTVIKKAPFQFHSYPHTYIYIFVYIHIKYVHMYLYYIYIYIYLYIHQKQQYS